MKDFKFFWLIFGKMAQEIRDFDPQQPQKILAKSWKDCLMTGNTVKILFLQWGYQTADFLFFGLFVLVFVFPPIQQCYYLFY